MSRTIRTRADIPANYKWNAASVYATDEAWEAEADSLLVRLEDLYAEGYGSEMQFNRERTGITWAIFSHLYQDYYVCQYSTGISGAHALSRRVLSSVSNAAEDYLRFLRAGSSVYPLDTLQLAGVDMSTPQPVEETFEILAQMVDRLGELTAAKP